ncbi:MAG: AI-2E family transporter, partial [Thermosynechococcaceae cyanobacterium]
LGVKLVLVNAVLAGLLTFIPNLGPILSVLPPALLALTDSPWKAVAVVVLYIVIQQLESNLLTPLVMAKQVSLLPALTLLSQVAFTIFFGFLGLFLALPIVVVAQVWLREILVKDIFNPWQEKVG